MSFPFEVRARVPYAARSAQELSLTAGQVVTVTAVDPTGVWYKTQGPKGSVWIPISYVDR